MKFLAGCLKIGAAGLLLSALLATASLTNAEPALFSQPPPAGSTNLFLAPLSSAPVVDMGQKPNPSQPLKAGVYQIRPDDIILVVPEAEHDDCCVIGATNDNSRMPVIKPGLQAVPKAAGQ